MVINAGLRSKGVEVRRDSDTKIKCRQCCKEFVFTAAEQEFYEQHGFTPPRRCKECRTGNHAKSQQLLCSQCGTQLDRDASLYCTNCLTNIRLEFELKMKNMETAVNEAYSKLRTAEGEKTECEESLRLKEQLVRALEQKVNGLSGELEKARQLHVALNQWFQPRLDSLEEKVEKRLEALETEQNAASERISQLIQRVHEMGQSMTLLELVKRSLRKSHSQITQHSRYAKEWESGHDETICIPD